MLKHNARSIDELKRITYGYAGCPVSIQDNNYFIVKNLNTYFASKICIESNEYNKNNIEYIKKFFSVFYR